MQWNNQVCELADRQDFSASDTVKTENRAQNIQESKQIPEKLIPGTGTVQNVTSCIVFIHACLLRLFSFKSCFLLQRSYKVCRSLCVFWQGI